MHVRKKNHMSRQNSDGKTQCNESAGESQDKEATDAERARFHCSRTASPDL